MESNTIIIISCIFVVLLILCALYYVIFVIPNAPRDPSVELANNFNLFNRLKLENEYNRKINGYIPDYLSKDIYKNSPTKSAQVFQDYFYHLNFALKCYYDDKEDIKKNLKEKEKYLPVLVFAKFIIDYDSYIRSIPNEKYKSMFDELYSKTPDILIAMNFLSRIADDYYNNQKHYNYIIFEKYIYKNKTTPEALNTQCPNFK